MTECENIEKGWKRQRKRGWERASSAFFFYAKWKKVSFCLTGFRGKLSLDYEFEIESPPVPSFPVCREERKFVSSARSLNFLVEEKIKKFVCLAFNLQASNEDELSLFSVFPTCHNWNLGGFAK